MRTAAMALLDARRARAASSGCHSPATDMRDARDASSCTARKYFVYLFTHNRAHTNGSDDAVEHVCVAIVHAVLRQVVQKPGGHALAVALLQRVEQLQWAARGRLGGLRKHVHAQEQHGMGHCQALELQQRALQRRHKVVVLEQRGVAEFLRHV